MLSLTRWSPLAEMNSLHRDLERAFGLSWEHFPGERDRAWVPATEVTSDNGGWKMRMALPGIDPKDVHVDLHRDVLTITGERNLQREEQTERHLSEFGYGRFERSFTLPDHVDTIVSARCSSTGCSRSRCRWPRRRSRGASRSRARLPRRPRNGLLGGWAPAAPGRRPRLPRRARN